MTATDVIRLIEEAWNEVPYPGDDKIFTPDSYDDEDIVNYFGGTTWRGHDPVSLRHHSSAFTFFTPEAFHYWLPAFLIANIQSPEDADVIGHYIPWALTDGRPSVRLSLFTINQLQAVAEYLRFQIRRNDDGVLDDRKALDFLEKNWLNRH
jgi:hypothetical protein